MVSVSQVQVLFVGFVLSITAICSVDAQAQTPDTPRTRMRPIGSPSAVDQYRQPTQPIAREFRETAYQSPVRQTAMLQQGGLTSPALPPGPMALPGDVNAVPVPGLPSNPVANAQVPAGGSDFRPVPQPQLQNSFATIDNCNLITPASAYSAAFGQGCGNTGYVVPQSYAQQTIGTPLTYTPPPAEIAAPAILPNNAGTGARAGAPIRSLVTLGQERFPVRVGQGLWGQPVAYVPGQPARNWVRYFFP
jgi:hypothetical protein